MIVSHKHRFIFVKTRKTAGTSIEVLLARHAGDDAIVTPIHDDDDVPEHQPRNANGFFNPLPELLEGGSRGRRGALADLRRRRAFFNHMTAAQVRARIGEKRWNDYFKFCFERDPWEKVVSFYFWQTKKRDPRPAFEQWVLKHPLPSDWPQYTIDDQVAVDFVGRYESLEGDLGNALGQVGLDVPIELPRVKSQYRPGGRAVEFTEAVDEKIARVFRREIETLGYTDRRTHQAAGETHPS